jgi:hypothetical protein
VTPEPTSANYEDWRETCDTLHAFTQILGKFAVVLAPAEPQLQHAALRQTSRGWETTPLPAPDGSGSVVVALDFHTHEAVVEHSSGLGDRLPLCPGVSVAVLTQGLVASVSAVAGEVRIDMTPQEVPWQTPLDQDEEHATYDPEAVGRWFVASTDAALALAEFRAPFRGRITPVNAWWGSFDLAVNLFTGHPAEPPSDDFIMRNAMDSQEVAVGWWPGDARYEKAAFYAYAHPAGEGFAGASLAPAPGVWHDGLGEFILDHDKAAATGDVRGAAVEFFRSAFMHACLTCGWDPDLAASAEGNPPPVR